MRRFLGVALVLLFAFGPFLPVIKAAEAKTPEVQQETVHIVANALKADCCDATADAKSGPVKMTCSMDCHYIVTVTFLRFQRPTATRVDALCQVLKTCAGTALLRPPIPV
jgi:hypothetical protein